MKVFHFIILWSLALTGICQNLISNGSFEVGNCPNSHSIKPNDFKVDDWFTPDDSTPDYFHVCAKEQVGIPKNWAGSQYPPDGEAYIGIYIKNGRYQENIGTELLSPLEQGETYLISFSIANVSNAAMITKAISLTLTDTKLQFNHIKNYDYRQISVKVPSPEEFMDFSWKKLTVKYTAQGGERYFYLGPLKNPSRRGPTNPYRIYDEPMLNGAAYVFLDDIEVIKEVDLQEEAPPTFELVSTLEPLNIYFEFDESYIEDDAVVSLDTLPDFIEREDLYVLITGATDSIGTSAYNLDLGSRRAQAVKEYLTFIGVNETRIEIKTKGEETPNYLNHSEEYRRLNRNALIEFFQKN